MSTAARSPILEIAEALNLLAANQVAIEIVAISAAVLAFGQASPEYQRGMLERLRAFSADTLLGISETGRLTIEESLAQLCDRLEMILREGERESGA